MKLTWRQRIDRLKFSDEERAALQRLFAAAPQQADSASPAEQGLLPFEGLPSLSRRAWRQQLSDEYRVRLLQRSTHSPSTQGAKDGGWMVHLPEPVTKP